MDITKLHKKNVRFVNTLVRLAPVPPCAYLVKLILKEELLLTVLVMMDTTITPPLAAYNALINAKLVIPIPQPAKSALI